MEILQFSKIRILGGFWHTGYLRSKISAHPCIVFSKRLDNLISFNIGKLQETSRSFFVKKKKKKSEAFLVLIARKLKKKRILAYLELKKIILILTMMC